MRFGLIGKTLGYSFSQKFFTERFAEWGLDYHYENYEVPTVSELAPLLAQSDCEGFNVTIPYKEQIIPLLAGLDPHAAAIGAVNTLLRKNGSWFGYNTDFIGFGTHLQEIFPKQWSRKALILGTGGAAKAIIYALQQLGFSTQSVSRKLS